MVSRKPGGEFRFRQNVDYGRFDSWRAHTTVETPEWNKLAVKFDYAQRETDGWTSNPAPGQKSFGLMEQRGWRVAARWQPTDVLTADYIYDQTELDSTQTYNHLVINSSVPAFQGIMAPYVHDTRQRNVPAPGLWNSPSNYELLGHAVALNWSVNDNLTLKSVTAYRENDSIVKGPNGFGILAPQPPIGFQGGQVSMELAAQEQFSQEFQLSGTADRLEYVIGALYFDEKINSSVWSLFTHVVPFTTGVPSLLPTPVETPRTSTSVNTKSIGVYSQVTWTPPVLEDRLSITAGLRYSKDDKDLLRNELNGVAVSIPVEADEERVDPAMTVAYKVKDDVSVYAR